MDELKKYLQDNRDTLDADTPRPKVWEAIQAEVKPAGKVLTMTTIIKWAAAACVVVLAGIGIRTFMQNDTPTETVAISSPKAIPPAVKIDTPDNTAPEQEPVVNNAPAEPVYAATKKPAYTNKQANNAATTADPSQVLDQLASSFVQVINLQRNRISTTPLFAETPAYFDDFTKQLSQMDKDEKQIRTDIRKQGLQPEMIDQLINVYQQKLDVLKQLQLEMNKLNNRYKQNRGPVDTTKTYFINI